MADVERRARAWAQENGLTPLGEPVGDSGRVRSIGVTILELHLRARTSEDELYASEETTARAMDAARKVDVETWLVESRIVV